MAFAFPDDRGGRMSAAFQVTNIHDGQTFDGRLYCEYFSVDITSGEKWAKKALAALKKSAKSIIPATLLKNVVFSSIDCLGWRVFTWRHGTDEWVNQTDGFDWERGYYEVKNRQVYAN